MMAISVTSDVLKALYDAAARAHPKEACGILLSQSLMRQGAKITQLVETANMHPAPETHFEVDPAALIDAYRHERSGGLEVIGYFHSHPKGAASPSEIDQAMAARDGKIWAIWSKDRLTFWRDAPAGFEPLSYEVIEG